MEANITGVVDNFGSFNVFGGWAKFVNGQASKPLRIVVCCDDEIIGACAVDLFRKDMQNNCGFNVVLSRDIDADEVKSDKVVFFAESSAGIKVPLRFYSQTMSAFEARCYGRRIGAASDHEVKQLLAGLTTKPSKPLLKEIARATELFKAFGAASIVGDIEEPEFSRFGLRVGLKSPDGSSIVGRDGTMFVLHGANAVLDQYRKEIDAPEIMEAAERWIQLFRQRFNGLNDRKVQYLQLIIPEKSSIVPELFPFNIVAPTALLRAITEKVTSDAAVAESYLDCAALMKESAQRSSIFRKVDSHLSASGARFLLSQILTRTGSSLNLPTDLSRSEILGCDLGSKFTFAKMDEELMLPSKQEFRPFEAGLREIEVFRPADGRHIGTRNVWKNSTAPTPLRVVAFGNSFFERGEKASDLSWWCARCFVEFHFLWQPELDYSYIEKVRPDVVICQSIERFLPRVPAS